MAKCKNCGKTLKSDAKFCTECGAVVGAEEAVEKVAEEVKATEKKAKKAAAEVKAEAAEVKAEVAEAVAEPAPAVEPKKPEPAPVYTPAPAQPVQAAPVQPVQAAPVKEIQVAESALPKKLRPLTTGKYMWMMFVMALPGINILYVIICALLNGINRNRRNYCRAVIYWFLIGLVIMIILAAVGYFWLWPTYGTEIMAYINQIMGQIPIE